MADFSTPFGQNAGRRLPTADEKINGFPCGPADQTLFNGLFHRLESEIGNVISYAGLTPTDANFNQLQQAITALVNAATGGGDTSNYVLMSQVRARLPIFPEIVSGDNRINVSTPAGGVVRIPGGITFMHRGVFPVVSVQTDFNIAPNKTYHLRWSPTNGFEMKDLADAGYNPSTLAEDNIAFDTKFDDMLIARVATSSTNVPTITNYANAARLRHYVNFGRVTGLALYGFTPSYGSETYYRDFTTSLNWGRRPDLADIYGIIGAGGPATPDPYSQANAGKVIQGVANVIRERTITRNAIAYRVVTDMVPNVSDLYAESEVTAIAF